MKNEMKMFLKFRNFAIFGDDSDFNVIWQFEG